MTQTFIHDPDAVLDYVYDWTSWLQAGETISSFTVTAPAGVTVGSGGQAPSQTGGKVTAWFTGGTAGLAYDIVCHIITTAGRQNDDTIRLRIIDQRARVVGTTSTASTSDVVDGGTP